MRYIKLLVILLFVTNVCAQSDKGVSYFSLSEVRLLDGPFYDGQKADLNYILALEPDRLLAPFLREAGLEPKAESYPNWESSGLDGHIGGHYLSALSLMYASTSNEELNIRLNYMLDELERCQNAVGTGFIGGTPGSLQLWDEIKRGDIRAGGFELNRKWVPLYNIHKTYNGLIDAYKHTKNEKALKMLVALTDWMIDVTQNLSDEQMQDMLRSEHGGLNESFADVYELTHDKKYLELAHRFSHNHILFPLIEQQDKLTGMHANTQIPKVIGFERIAEIENNSDWEKAVLFFWNNVVNSRSISIGGNSVREHFHPINDFSSMMESIEGPETCNSYNMLKLTKMLYGKTIDPSYMDFYERTLFNHILSSINSETGGLVYFTPMRPGHYRVYSQPETSFWCCVGSGIENHAKYAEMIYAQNENDLYVNLFIPSVLESNTNGIKIIQTTQFPESDKIQFEIQNVKSKSFTLNVRHPSWVKENSWTVSINGKDVKANVENGYLVINRKWRNGDKVVVTLPMHLTLDQMPDKSQNFAFRYGPIVLAAATGTEDLNGLYADDSRGGHIAHGKQIPTYEMPSLIGSPSDILESMHKKSDALVFEYHGQTFPDYKQIEFIPFNKLHEKRYFVYFPQVESSELKGLISNYERIKKEEQQVTLDLIYPGEQQPESDHNIKHENSQTGVNDGKLFRSAKGYFSYQVNLQENASELQLLVRANSNKGTAIYINDSLIDVEPLKIDDDKGYTRLIFPVELTKGSYVITFKPNKSESTDEIYEVRFVQ